jgi:hypothetical protein
MMCAWMYACMFSCMCAAVSTTVKVASSLHVLCMYVYVVYACTHVSTHTCLQLRPSQSEWDEIIYEYVVYVCIYMSYIYIHLCMDTCISCAPVANQGAIHTPHRQECMDTCVSYAPVASNGAIHTPHTQECMHTCESYAPVASHGGHTHKNACIPAYHVHLQHPVCQTSSKLLRRHQNALLCMHGCMYVYTCVCRFALWVHECVHVKCGSTHNRGYRHVMYVCMYVGVRAFMDACMYVNVDPSRTNDSSTRTHCHVCMYVCICIFVYMYLVLMMYVCMVFMMYVCMYAVGFDDAWMNVLYVYMYLVLMMHESM